MLSCWAGFLPCSSDIAIKMLPLTKLFACVHLQKVEGMGLALPKGFNRDKLKTKMHYLKNQWRSKSCPWFYTVLPALEEATLASDPTRAHKDALSEDASSVEAKPAEKPEKSANKKASDNKKDVTRLGKALLADGRSEAEYYKKGQMAVLEVKSAAAEAFLAIYKHQHGGDVAAATSAAKAAARAAAQAWMEKKAPRFRIQEEVCGSCSLQYSQSDIWQPFS